MVRIEKRKEDIKGMKDEEGILKKRGGMKRNEEVVERGMGKKCV